MTEGVPNGGYGEMAGMSWVEKGREYVKLKWTQLTFGWDDLDETDDETGEDND